MLYLKQGDRVGWGGETALLRVGRKDLNQKQEE